MLIGRQFLLLRRLGNGVVSGRTTLAPLPSFLYVHEMSTGRRLYQLPLEIGTISGIDADKRDNELFLAFESFLVPMIEYRMDFTGVPIDQMPEMKEIRRVQLNGLEKEQFSVEQIFYPSKDGTKIPMYLISNKGMERSSDNPVILDGYGGFGVPYLPYFDVSRLLFVRHFGGAYAVANLRGGGHSSRSILGGPRALSLRRLIGYAIASGRTTHHHHDARMCLIGLMAARRAHSSRPGDNSRVRVAQPLASTTFAKYPHGFRMCSTAIDCSAYPSARKDDSIVDDYHGHKICDPYRYMENPDGAETKEFVDKLNAISTPFIEKSEHREDCRKRLTELWNYEKFTVTSKRGAHYYYKHNSGLQNQYVTYQMDALGGKGRVFFDPNTLSEDGTTFLRSGSFTKDGTLYAYGLSEKGSDWMTIKFKTSSGEDLKDEIPGAKFSGISWTGDNSGVFYSRYPHHKGATEGTSAEKHEWHSLYYHKMGTKAEEDVLVYKRTDNPDMMIDGTVTDDGRFLIISAARGCDPYNMLYYFDLKAVDNKITGPIEAVPLFDTLEAKYEYIDHDDDKMIIRTNKGAPMFKIVTMSLKGGAASMADLIPENSKANLEWACPLIGGRLVVGYIEDVKATLYMHEQSTGRRLYQIPLDIGTVSGFYADKKENELFLAFESFLVPMIEYRMDFTGVPIDQMPEMKEIRRVQINGMEKEAFRVEQVFYPSKDGTKIPMYIISNKGMQRNGENPVILNGYGGFNVAEMPYFSVSRLLFVRHFGGVYACANLRGGSEYGEAWHEAGMKENKQNVFDDFISAGEYLVREKITKPAKLTINGGSNGGLLVGACSQQRPDLFGCAINEVGVLDMLRFHKFTIGGAWVPEYGCADVKEEFDNIIKYSPLHNLEIPSGGQWPATLLMTADHDDRVVPSHTLKYIATLYEKAKEHGNQSNPIMARVEVNAGHGAGKPTSKIIAEEVDMYAFIQRVVGLKWIP